jgi:uncharacterized coiled-coil protein SlyX
VAHLFDNHPDDAGYETEPVPAPQRMRWATIAIAAVLLAVIGASSAVLWRAYGGVPLTLPSFAWVTGQPATPAVVADKPVGLKDLQALQQQIAGPLQSNAQLLAAQQAELKRLADQLSALTAKVDALEHPSASAQASLPASAPPPAAPRKKPAAPKLPPGISTGGAPLPVTPSR